MSDLTVRVDSPAHGGFCVGRTDGRVVFVGYSLPGETVSTRLTEDGDDRRFWRADALGVVADPHRQRTHPPCPWFGPGLCGGCSWLHAEPGLQADLKARVLRETLQRIGGIDTGPVQVRSLGMDRGWRTRVTLHTDDAGRAGFHALRSNVVVDVGDCLQAHPDLGLPDILQQRWPPHARLHVSLSSAGRAVAVTSPEGRMVDGPSEHVHDVAGRTFRCAVDGFWQSHIAAAPTLSDELAHLVGPSEGASLLDLYAGVGVFGLSLLDRVDRAVLVEGDRIAAGFARRNAGGDPRVRVVTRDVKRWIRDPPPADVVVLDPPRAGAGRRVVHGIAGTGASVVLYVSCEPSTLARDLAHFRDVGYRPDHIEGFDLFPGTAHIETVVRLRRR